MRAQESSVVSVGVIDFQAEGISDLEVQTLTQRFTSELNNTAKAILSDRDVLNDQITGAGMTVAGCKTPNCVLSTIGDLLGVQYIVTGSISKNGDRYALAAVLTDVVTREAERVLSTDYSGPVDGMITELEIMAWEIMDQEPPEALLGKRKGKTKKKLKKPQRQKLARCAGTRHRDAGLGSLLPGSKSKRENVFRRGSGGSRDRLFCLHQLQSRVRGCRSLLGILQGGY